ncbi:flagellar hook-associated protein FlgK [Aestuariibius insulae]|uniref:flagellar hook-associated protein FlgK n=1 Tax=Aestuariibius insulae TaxID=2058287 RepID=UPI00345E58EA
MSITQSMANALSGLTAASRTAEVVSSNLANALTDGYGRRSIELTGQAYGGTSAGVQVVGISRNVDVALLADRRIADGALSSDRSMREAASRLEDLMGDPASGGHLANRINDLEGAFRLAASDPSSQLRLDGAADAIVNLAREFNRIEDGVQTIRLDAETSISKQVERLNQALGAIETINADIQRSGSNGLDVNALLDQRQMLVDEVNEIVPVRELVRDNGRIALMSQTGALLIDGKATRFEFDPVSTMTADLSATNGTLDVLTMNGLPFELPSDPPAGSLSAAFQVRDETTVSLQRSVDAAAAEVAARLTGAPASSPDAPGANDILLDGSGAVDLADLTGLAGRLSVNAKIVASSVVLRDGLDAIAPGAAGDARQLNGFASALSSRSAILPGTQADTAAGIATSLVSDIASLRLAAERNESLSAARADTLKAAELANGVDSDAELQQLLLVEQNYAANARVIQTIDALIQTLIEI